MKLNRKLTWLCCSALFWSCLSAVPTVGDNPKDADIVSVAAYASHKQIHPRESFQVAIVVAVRPGFHINSHSPRDEFLIPTSVELDQTKEIAFSPMSYPKPDYASFSFFPDKMAVYAGEVTISTRGLLSGDIPLGEAQVSGKVSYQACDDKSCFMPRSVRFEIPLQVVKTSEPIELANEHIFKQSASFTSDERQAGQVIERGLAYAVIAFFVFGLALNLTPCVYPVIPITLSFFAAQSEQKRSRVFVLASYYVVGIAIVFSVLGLLSALAGRQWGFLFQNPWFVIVISIIILSMAASMFGAFEFTVPSVLMTRLGPSRRGAVGSFIMGLTVGVVIAPCAAGIVIGLIGIIAKLGIVLKGTLLFFVMGLGLGLPYLFLAVSSGLLNRLPRSGMWMVWVRKFFGVLLVGVALYFLIPQGKAIQDQEGFYLGVLGIFGGLFLGFLEQGETYGKCFRVIRGAIGFLLILAGILFVHRAISPGAEMIDWVYYKNQPWEQLQREDKPLLINFYADWCAACKELDRKTFGSKEVTEKSRRFTMVRVDCTSPGRSNSLLTKKFEVSGLPTVVFISSKGEELRSLRTVGFVTPAEMSEKMADAVTR